MSIYSSQAIPGDKTGLSVLEAVNHILSERLTCETEEDLGKVCLDAAEKITQSKFGFIGEINVLGKFDTLALSNPGWLECAMHDPDIPLLINDMTIRGLWGKVITEQASFFTNDPMNHPEAHGLPKGHPPLTSFLGVPLFREEKIIGMIALANKLNGYVEDDLNAVSTLSLAMVEALYSKRAEDAFKRQSQEIMELSTPVIRVWQGVVAAPLIGVLDSERTRNFMERFLDEIVNAHAEYALIDITGVPSVDTLTAQNLLEATTAARLLGTKVVLTGVRPAIAQTMVHLGVNLEEIETKASFFEGLKLCLGKLNFEVVEH